MRVERSNISKAQVSPYMGSEIPDFEALGLEPQRVYYLLRDPAELERAAPTFRNIPLLITHVPVTADEPRKDLIVGSIGSDVSFAAPYLYASLSIWDAAAIAGVETKEQTELSSAYRYRADMTPGEFEGEKYDGVMRDIIGNHVALVEVGRAGTDVIVGDSNPFRNPQMPKLKAASPLAIMIAGALRSFLAPKLAQDAKLGSLRPIVGDVTAATYAKDRPAIVKRAAAAVKGKLAQDVTLEPGQLDGILDSIIGVKDGALCGDDADMVAEPAEDEEMEDDPDNPGKKRPKQAKDSVPPAPPEDGAEKPTKAAMDAAIKNAAAQARADALRDVSALFQARKEVAPIVGECALDSAEAVYRFALDHAKIDTAGVHPSAFRSMVTLLLARPERPAAPVIGQDAAASASVVKQFPAIGRFQQL